MDIKKSIIKTIWLTLISMMLLTIIAGVVLVFVFTKQCASFMYDIGCNNIASILYYKSYEDNGDIIDCYKALNIKIVLGDDDKIIEYYEDLVANENFEEFMSLNLDNAEKLDVSVLEKSTILNDRNYLVNAYVRALIANEEFNKAKEVSINEFALYNSFTFKEQGVYTIGQFVDGSSLEFFSTHNEVIDGTLIGEMQKYFDNIVLLFDANKNVSNIVDKSYLVALGNRVIDVGQDINAIYTGLNVEEEKVNLNASKMLMVNNVIKGII